MFELTNIEGNISIKCEVIGYEFPDNPKDDWCILKVTVKQGDKHFEKLDPAIEANDIVDIYQWFKSLSENRLPRFAHLDFVEPCISFEYLAYRNNTVRLSVNLSDELKPNFELEPFKSNSKDWRIVFELKDRDFARVLSELKRTMKQYPVRNKDQT